jgi:TPR repeat protein
LASVAYLTGIKIMKKVLHATLVSFCVSVTPAHADDTRIASVDEAWQVAQSQYADGRFADAFGNFYWAAIRDHAQAQEIVGMMLLLGPASYGPDVRRDPREAEFWLAEAGSRGREVARHVLCMGRRDAPRDAVASVAAAAGARACAHPATR